MEKFKLIPLPDLLSKIVDNRGKSCPTTNSGFPLIATNCIKTSNLYPVFENIRYISEDTKKKWFRAQLKPNDIIFVNKGTPGRTCLVPNPVPFCIAQDMIALRCNPLKIDYKYLFAVLRSSFIQKKIKNYRVGIMIPHFKKDDLKELLIPVPEDRNIQENIGQIYFILSYLAEINNKKIEVLSSLIQILYNYWFLQFDFPDESGRPYRASGGKMVWNEELEREIPEGWKVNNIYAIANYYNGIPCQK